MEKRRIEVNEVTTDVVSHLLVVSIKIESLAFEQTLTEPLDILTHVMEGDAIGHIRHIEGLSHLLIGYSPLLVEHRKHRAQEDKATTRVKHLVGISYQLRDDGEFPFISEVGRFDSEKVIAFL